jgi:hypothetical protein
MELAIGDMSFVELLSKWHPTFQGVVKARKGHRLQEHDVQDIDSQVVDASYL